MKETDAPFPARGRMGAVVFDNHLWVIGGGDYRFLRNDVWKSPDGVTWAKEHTTGAIFSRRGFHGAAVFNGALWVSGGRSPDSYSSYDIWSSTDGVAWKRNNETLYSYYSINSFVTGGFLVVVHDDNVIATPDGARWAYLPDFDYLYDPGRASALFGGRLWMIGGGDTYEVTNESWSGALISQ